MNLFDKKKQEIAKNNKDFQKLLSSCSGRTQRLFRNCLAKVQSISEDGDHLLIRHLTGHGSRLQKKEIDQISTLLNHPAMGYDTRVTSEEVGGDRVWELKLLRREYD